MVRYLFIIIILFSISDAKAQTNLIDVEELKIKYIKNLIRYTSWQNVVGESQDITLCIKGSYKQYSRFNSININKENYRLTVKYNVSLQKITMCNAIYIPYINKKMLPNILKIVANLPILTIGERDMAWQNAIIAIYKKRDKLSFSVNMKALNLSGIRIYPQILQMAHLIEE